MNTKVILKKNMDKKVLFSFLFILGVICLFLFIPDAYADDKKGLAGVAKNILDGLAQIGAAIFAAAYVAGAGFALGAMMKFKQHKDNPTQIPIGTPLALLFIAVALLFLPSLLKVSSESLFTKPEASKPGGFEVQSGGGGGSTTPSK
jgi:intracellular multiplication protein IcmD